MPKLYQAVAGMNGLEQLASGDSVIHRVHPMAKLLTTLVYVITVVSLPATNVSGLVPFIFYPVILMALSGTPYRPLLGRAAVALPFSLAGGISSLLLMRTTAFILEASPSVTGLSPVRLSSCERCLRLWLC